MRKEALFFFIAGVGASLGLAALLHSMAPQGILLYTPGPGTDAQYTSSSSIAFIVAMFGLSTLSAVVALVSYIWQIVSRNRSFDFTVQASFLMVGFGGLSVFAMLTERLWP
jgi:acyl-CoA synthetase (AMP-forming)/AMP-acid ligase II